MKLKKLLEYSKLSKIKLNSNPVRGLKNEGITRKEMDDMINFIEDYHRKDLDKLREKMQDIIEVLSDKKFKKTNIREYLYWAVDITV